VSGTGNAGWQGRPPVIKVGKVNPESLKYKKMWEMEEYRKVSPGEELADAFIARAKPKPDAHVIDFGCGTGRGGLALHKKANLRVTFVDFVKNCLDPEVKEAIAADPMRLRFVQRDLEMPFRGPAEYGFCTDVLEHIPPDQLDKVLGHILHAARDCFFSITCKEDVCGKLIDEPLHLSIHPYSWWLEKFGQFGCKILYARGVKTGCIIYCSAWMGSEDLAQAGSPNTPARLLEQNVAFNVEQGWQSIEPCLENKDDIMIIGGGSSLPQFLDKIKELRAEGVKLITLNGAYKKR